MSFAAYLVVFLFGLVIGSFINVVIARWNTGMTLGGRSRCFSCSKTLRAGELVPVLSFLIQRGRCKRCKAKISWQYPAVELLTGLVFVAVFSKTIGLFAAALFLIAFCLLIVISVYDIKHTIIPDPLAYLLIAIGLIATCLPLAQGQLPALEDLLAGPALAAPFAALWLVSRGRWMGLGDAKLMLGIGWLVGFQMGLAAFMLAFWIGAVGGVLMLLLGRRHLTMKSEIPFGPFLALGSFLAFFFGITFSSIQSFASVFLQ